MSDIAVQRAKLRDIIQRLSFFRGDITLASGKKSTFYFDMKPSMFDPNGADLMSDLIVERLKDVPCDLVGGLEMGAVPLISPIGIKSLKTSRPMPGFFVRKAVKDHGTKKLIDGVGDVKGKSVVIVEDVTTTGQSAMQAVRALEAAGAKITLVISIVDREDGAEDLYREAGIPFAPLFKAHEFLAG